MRARGGLLRKDAWRAKRRVKRERSQDARRASLRLSRERGRERSAIGSHTVLLKTSQIGAIGSHTELRPSCRQDNGTPATDGGQPVIPSAHGYPFVLSAGFEMHVLLKSRHELMLKVQRPARRRQ